eukprot:7242054-Pyramimonas_sp.AAC.1
MDLLEWGAWGVDVAVNAVRKNALKGKGYLPVGTLAWMAPEMMLPPYEGDPLLDDPAAWGKCDVYGFGCLLYELVTRLVPWPADKKFGKDEVLQAVVHEGWRPELPENISPKLKLLMHDCWLADPVARPSMVEVVDRLRGLQ